MEYWYVWIALVFLVSPVYWIILVSWVLMILTGLPTNHMLKMIFLKSPHPHTWPQEPHVGSKSFWGHGHFNFKVIFRSRSFWGHGHFKVKFISMSRSCQGHFEVKVILSSRSSQGQGRFKVKVISRSRSLLNLTPLMKNTLIDCSKNRLIEKID